MDIYLFLEDLNVASIICRNTSQAAMKVLYVFIFAGFILFAGAVTRNVGHRGSSGDFPENTLLSLQQAFENHADGVEFDLQVTQDGVVILMHDETVDRTTNGKGRVSSLTWSYISTLDAGSWKNSKFAGTRVPKFTDVLDYLQSRNDASFAVVDIKNTVAASTYANIASIVRSYPDLQNRLLIGGWIDSQLQTFHSLLPGYFLVYIATLPPSSSSLSKYKSLGVIGLNLSYQFLSAKYVADAHNSVLNVFAWTVNSDTDMRNLIGYEVDAILTDYPANLYKILAAKQLNSTEWS